MNNYIKLDIINISDDSIMNKDFIISNNDKTIDMKEKIFTYYKDPKTFWIPEYVTLMTDKNKKKQEIKEEEEEETESEPSIIETETEISEGLDVLKNNSLNIISKKEIYADNLLDNLRKVDFVNIYYDEKRFNNAYVYYKNIYQDLTEALFQNAFKILLYQFDKIQYEKLFSDVKTFALEIVERQKNYITKWSKIDNILNPVLKYEDKVETKDGMSKILNLEILFINKASVPQMLNVFNVFNNVKLSNKYIAVITNGSFIRKKEPILKIFEELPKNLSKSDIKEWILNEKKKDNVISYKKIKGVVFKIIHNDILFTLNLNASGSINISYEVNSKVNMYIDVDYDTIINYINELYIDFINYINEFDNVYNANIILSNTEFYTSIKNLSGEIETSERIQKNAFSEFCLQKTINENLFTLKDVKSLENISLFYTKNIQDDTKGITVNIKDNPYVIDSSIITILGCKNMLHALIILKYINMINYYNTRIKELEQDEPQKIKKKSTIKDLKKQGVETISTNCQRPRQPIVDTDNLPLKDSYKLVWKNQTYVCPKEEYKYPGFTNKNIVCCFSKDQRRTPKYIKNLKSDELEIIVQSSNYPIEIVKDGVTKKTLLIKLISASEEFKSKSIFPYYYLDFIEKDRLGIEPLTDKSLIETIQRVEQESSIWLEPVSLSQIITTAPKNKCNQTPNLTGGNINNVCENHSVHRYFGYNQNSYPCCFDKPRDIFVKIKTKDRDDDIIKQHILQNDKILDINRIGLLPEYINSIFNVDDVLYYRLGVIQNKESILNCILICIDKTFDSKKFSNTFELKNYLSEKISELKLFNKIYNGNMIQFWDNEEDFIKDFISDNVYIDYKIILDIVFNILKINVMIIDVNEESSENSKIICNNNFNKGYKSIILLKRNIDSLYKTPQFEILIELQKNIIKKRFDSNFKFVKLLNEFIEKSCIETVDYPSNYSFDEFIKISDFEPIDIEYQIINNFNKVNWIILKKLPKLILPIEETFIIDNVDIKKFENISEFFPIDDNLEYIEKLNKIYSLNISSKGVVKTDTDIDGVLLSYGLFLPVKKITTNEKYLTLNFNYYPTLDKYIDFKVVNNSLENFDKINKNIYNIKKNVAFNLNKQENQDLKIEIIDTVNSIKSNNDSKFKFILKKLNKIYKNNDNTFQFYLRIVINDIINDTVKMSVLNNNVVLYKTSIEKIVKNENEILLLNLNDFLSYIK